MLDFIILELVLRIRDVYSWSEFFPSRIPDPGSKIFPDPGSGSAPQNSSILTQKSVCKVSEIWSKIFIPIRILIFFTHSGSQIPDPGVKKAPDPGSGSATLLGILTILPDIRRGVPGRGFCSAEWSGGCSRQLSRSRWPTAPAACNSTGTRSWK